jgi:hypothetical protein
VYPVRLHVLARMIPTAEGGRRNGISDNYRPDWTGPSKPDLNGAMVQIDEPLGFDETKPAVLHVFFPALWRDRVAVGDRLVGHEGPKPTIIADVLSIDVAGPDDPVVKRSLEYVARLTSSLSFGGGSESLPPPIWSAACRSTCISVKCRMTCTRSCNVALRPAA